MILLNPSFLTKTVAASAAAVFLVSCNGMFAGIYDNDDTDNAVSEYGFVGAGADGSQRIYVDATSYTIWNYLDIRDRHASTAEIVSGEEMEPKTWDFAIHRYDAKTNGGRVMATSLTSLAEAAKLTAVPAGEWVSDIWTTNVVICDMSQMMDGIIGYAESYYNPELSSWVTVDTSNMPPSYSMNPNVYILELADKTHAALQLVNFMDSEGVKGFMTVDYIYPLKF